MGVSIVVICCNYCISMAAVVVTYMSRPPHLPQGHSQIPRHIDSNKDNYHDDNDDDDEDDNNNNGKKFPVTKILLRTIKDPNENVIEKN